MSLVPQDPNETVESFDDVDWENIPQQNIDLMVQQAKDKLQAQFEASLSADQRAATTSAFFGALASAIIAAAVAYWSIEKSVPIVILAGVCAALMIAGALVCLWSARPIPFDMPGSEPKYWLASIHNPAQLVLAGEAMNIQQGIEANNRRLNANGRAMYFGALLSTSSPIIALILWFILELKSFSRLVETCGALLH